MKKKTKSVGRPHLPESQKHSELVKVAFTKDEKSLIEFVAHNIGHNQIAPFIRRAVINHLKGSNSKYIIYRESNLELKSSIIETSRNINQISKKINESRTASRSEYENLYREIKKSNKTMRILINKLENDRTERIRSKEKHDI